MAQGSRRPHDSRTGHTFHYAPEADGQPAMAIVEAVSWVEGVDVLDLEPLQSAIDTDSLNDLFGEHPDRGDFYRSSSDSSISSPRVTFRYEGHRISVTSDRIQIE